ncbi:unnamed protein product [Linum trigynum]|uniref:Uncharacterized protein n=1 Tax=Linum trigynum TaxID=586398 RepID=A0AAV2CY55_9ROSI
MQKHIPLDSPVTLVWTSGRLSFEWTLGTTLISFEILKSRSKDLIPSEDGIWGPQDFSFLITNTLDMKCTVFHLSVPTNRRVAGYAMDVDGEKRQEAGVREEGVTHLPTYHAS